MYVLVSLFSPGLTLEIPSPEACLLSSSGHLLQLREEPLTHPSFTADTNNASSSSNTSSIGGGGGGGGTRSGRGGGIGLACVKIGVMLPENWLPGVSQVATEEFGCRVLTPMLALNTPGRGVVKLIDIEGPGILGSGGGVGGR